MEKEFSLKREVKERVSKVAVEWMSELDKNIKSKMENALLSLLGLEQRNRGYEIDHCNSRNSVFIDIIREKAKSDAAKIVGKLNIDFETKKLFEEAFKKEYKSAFSSEINTLARASAKAEATKLFDELFEKELKKTILE
jgi:hypothetical protein